MDWFKKHADTMVILSTFAGAMMWINGTLLEIRTDIHSLDKEMAVIKTVLIMKNVMPKELAVKEEK